MIHPGIGSWISEDGSEVIVPDLHLYRYVHSDLIKNTDPSGMWTVRRNPNAGRTNDSKVEAIAGENATITSLARIEGYDPLEFEKWLDLPKGTKTIKLADGKQIEPDKLTVDMKLASGEKFLVPNLILMLWIGDLTNLGGQVAVGWQTDEKWFQEKGYATVLAQDYKQEFLFQKPKQVLGKNDILDLVRNFARTKRLAGIEITGHGSPEGFGNQGPIFPRPGQPIAISYKEMRETIGYGLSWVILNVCSGGYAKGDVVKGAGEKGEDVILAIEGGRDLSSKAPGSRFGGTKNILFPPFGTFHPKELKPMPIP